MNLDKKIIILLTLVIIIAAYFAPPVPVFENKVRQVAYADLVNDSTQTAECKIFETKSKFTNGKHGIHKTQLTFNCPFPTHPIVILSSYSSVAAQDLSSQSVEVTYLEKTNCVVKLRGIVKYDFPFKKSYEELLADIKNKYHLKKEFNVSQNKGLLFMFNETLMNSSTSCDELKI